MSALSDSLSREPNGSQPQAPITQPYTPRVDSGEPHLLAVAPGQVPESEPRASSRALLHLRLRILCVLGFGGWSLFDILLFGDLDPVYRLGVVAPGCVALIIVTTVAPVVSGALLFFRPRLSVGWLRAIEVHLVCLCILSMTWLRYSILDHSLVVAGAATDAEAFGPLYATAFNNLTLLCVVVVFGVLIPNHWTRTLLVVAGLTLVPLTAECVCRLNRFPAGGHYLLTSAIITVLTLFIGAGVTVFGSYRIGRLQRQVREARRLLRQFGQYKLIRRLGSGGMGEVYLAEHQLLKRPCAVKLIRPEKAVDDTFVKRFEREVAAATRLAHPAAVQVYDYGRADDGSFYYVMEYLPGLTLDEVVKRGGPLPPARVIHILRQVCGALRAAHLMGLVHRDVKPGNVMLCSFADRADVAKLLDFGLVAGEAAQDETRLTQVGGILGTPAYMSPEQARGADVGPAADLYSLGTVGFFLLTGRPPFDGTNSLELLHAHLTAPVPSPSERRPEVPADLEAVILRLLAKDPADRFAAASDLDTALGACRCAEDWAEADAVKWWEAALATDQSTPAEPAAPAARPRCAASRRC